MKLIEVIKSESEKKYTLVDIFTGTGVFTYAFDQTNKVKTIFANDILDRKYLI